MSTHSVSRSTADFPADKGVECLSKVPWVSDTHMISWTDTGTSKPGQWLWIANQPAMGFIGISGAVDSGDRMSVTKG